MNIKIIDYGYNNIPKRAHYNDAGADVYTLEDYEIPGNTTMAIPLGFGLELPDGLAALVMPRAGMARKGISCELAPIDSGYNGEIHAIVINNNSKTVEINKGTRIGQLVVFPIILPTFTDELGDHRGSGAFGSTGNE